MLKWAFFTRRIFPVSGISFCLALALPGCRRAQEVTAFTLPTAPVVAVKRGDLATHLSVAGQFQPYQEVDLHAKVSGYIREIRVDIGDRVKQGEVLAVLEVPELDAQLQGTQAAVRHSQAQIQRAQGELQREEATHEALHSEYKRLAQAAELRPGLIAQQELDDALAKDQSSEAQVLAAKSALEAAQQQLDEAKAENARVRTLFDYSTITAPFTGVVTWRYADTGSLIQAGTSSSTQSMPVVRVAQSDLLRLRMPVPESDVPYIEKGGRVQIHIDATGKTVTGKIVRFTRSLDSSTRTMTTEVDIPNPDLTLSPGMYAETTIQLQARKNVLILPAQAVVQNQSSTYVLVLNGQDQIQQRDVSIGLQTPNEMEIASGLEEGDRVIAAGQSNFQVGQTVRPKFITPLTMPKEESN
jgi:RND family efflux transporter MFP subunit